MSPQNEIIIYADAIQTGKTSRVLTWISKKQNVYGILTPDVADKRRLYDIAAKKLTGFEVDSESTEETVKIGHFNFLKSAFDQAKDILKSAIQNKPNWLIIDEIGKLEMDNKGLEPELSLILDDCYEQSPQTKILLIIRDKLLDAAIDKYQLQSAKVVDYKFFFSEN